MTTIATIYGPAMWGQSAKRVRQYAEPAGAFLVPALMIWKAGWIAEKFADKTAPWSAAGLYSEVFSWASIQAGLLFAIYTFVMPRSEPFVRAVAGHSAFLHYKLYMLRTVYLTVLVAMLTLALMTVNPTPPPEGVTFWVL